LSILSRSTLTVALMGEFLGLTEPPCCGHCSGKSMVSFARVI
jgi:hypothetical protein